MHSSIFSYNITRPYPYKWFTPVAITGAIIFAVLFSLINFESNGYELVSKISNDPNTTIADVRWYKHWPSLLVNKLQPSCEPVTMPVSSQFSTNQTGLAYTLTSIKKSDNSNLPEPSLTYMNNPLHNCVVNSILLAFETTDRPCYEISIAWWGIVATAFITCEVHTTEGIVTINTTANYNAVPSYPTPGVSSFISHDPTTKASMYWAESLLSVYWSFLSSQLKNVADGEGSTAPVKGYMTLTPTQSRTTIDNITAMHFFSGRYQFLNADSSWTYGAGTIEELVQGQNSPNVWTQIDGLAKSMYSAVLADLGQTPPSPGANIVTDLVALQEYSSVFLTYKDSSHAHENVGPATQPFDAPNSSTGPLGISPSVISGEYLCQVPQRKSSANIIVAVLVADLVFLQTLWTIYIYAIDLAVLRRQPEARHCEGCKCQKHEGSLSSGSDAEVKKPKLGAIQRFGFWNMFGREPSEQPLLPSERSGAK